MKRRELVVLALVVIQAPLFILLYRAHSKATPGAPRPAATINVSSQRLIGNETELLGNRQAPYTLIEFGDYQCPACAYRLDQVKSLLADYPLELRFNFHHFPLRGHTHAMDCALTAEKARALGRFWEVHDHLYALKSKVAPPQIAAMRSEIHLDLSALSQSQQHTAQERIAADMKLGAACHIDETPSFLLCKPDGQVVKLGDLSQLESLITSK